PLSGAESARAGPPAAERGAAAPGRGGLPGGVRTPPGRADLHQPGRRNHGRPVGRLVRQRGPPLYALGGLLASPKSAVAGPPGSRWLRGAWPQACRLREGLAGRSCGGVGEGTGAGSCLPWGAGERLLGGRSPGLGLEPPSPDFPDDSVVSARRLRLLP